MKRHLTLLLPPLLSGALLLMSSPARAFYLTEHAPACGGRRVSEIGSAVVLPVEGFGDGVPLKAAVRILLPPGWVWVIPRPLRDSPVSWRTGEAWTSALTNVHGRHDCFVIDFRDRTFYASTRRGWETMMALVDRRDRVGYLALEGAARPALAGAVASGRGRGIVGDYHVFPGGARAQAADWAWRDHDRLRWDAPDFAVGRRERLRGPLRHALGSLLAYGEARTGRRYRLSWHPASRTLRVYIAPPPPPPAPVPVWTIRPGGLRPILREWAKRAGWQLIWRSPRDYLVSARATIRGPFLHAVSILFDTLARAGSPARVEIYRSNRVLVVRRGL